MQNVDGESIPAIILSLDFEKAFDKRENTAILGSLYYFNFGPVFIKWVHMLHMGI